MATQNANMFTEAFARAVKGVVEEQVKKAVEQAKRDLDAQVPAMIAQVAVSIQQSFEAQSSDAVIQVRISPRWR